MRFISNIIGHLHRRPISSTSEKNGNGKTTEAYLSKYFIQLYLNDSIDDIDVLYTDGLNGRWTTTMKKFQWSISFRVNVWWIEITWWWIIFYLFIAQLGAIHSRSKIIPFILTMISNDFDGNDANNKIAKLKSYKISRKKLVLFANHSPIHTNTHYINRST